MRKSGSKHRQSGLNTAEQELQTAIQKAREDMEKGQRLSKQWADRTICYSSMNDSEWNILRRFWDGELSKRLEELNRQRKAGNSCRRPRLSNKQ